MAPSSKNYVIVWSEGASSDLDALDAFAVPKILRAVEAGLITEPEVQTRHRKPLREPLADLPEATWQLAVEDMRVLYRVEEEAVRILAVILKGRLATAEAVRRRTEP
jgi:mRNA-degrading endonuclease RelE of RelBE toxin-antitoxin system